MINELREKNKLMMYTYTKDNNQEELVKHRIIDKILEHDDCFQKLSLEESYTILKSLKIKDWKKAYSRLLSIN